MKNKYPIFIILFFLFLSLSAVNAIEDNSTSDLDNLQVADNSSFENELSSSNLTSKVETKDLVKYYKIIY